MKNKSAIKRYAEGFLKAAKDTTTFDTAVEEIRMLHHILRDHPLVIRYLSTPVLSQEEKKQFIGRLLVGHFSETLKNFIYLLIHKHRIELLPDIMDYIRLTYAHGENLKALLRTSFPLDLEVLRSVKGSVEKKINRQIKMYVELAPDLLGGVNVRVGNTLFDFSVRTSLGQLKEKLLAMPLK